MSSTKKLKPWDKLKISFKNNWQILAIFLLAYLLRIIGVSHGYPYILNIDEPALVRSTQGLFFSRTIDHFDWPHFNYYFNFIFYFAFVKFRAVLQILQLRPSLESPFPVLWNDPFIFYVISRKLNALLGALTVFPVYLLAREIYSKKVAILTAFILALIPYGVEASHFAQLDVSILFWLSWAIYFSYLAASRSSAKYFIVAGAIFGIATSIKYNIALFAIFLPVFVWIEYFLRKNENDHYLKITIPRLIYSLLACIATFGVINYQIFTNWDIFWSYEYGRGILWQLTENVSPLGIKEMLPFMILKSKELFISLGYLPFILYFSSGVLTLYYLTISLVSRKRKLTRSELYFIGIFIVSFLLVLFTSRYKRATSHYYIPFYFAIALSSSYMVFLLKDKYAKLVSYIVVVVLLTLSIKTTYTFIKPETTRLALSYYEINKNRDLSTYYSSDKLSEMNGINNLDMKRLSEKSKLMRGDVILSDHEINGDKIILVEKIDESDRRGNTIYVYQKTE